MLFYKDFDHEGLGRKADAIYALVQGLLQRGVPIHGVGFQMHVHLGRYPTPQHVAANMTRFAALSLQVHVTEMDVGIHGSVLLDLAVLSGMGHSPDLRRSISSQARLQSPAGYAARPMSGKGASGSDPAGGGGVVSGALSPCGCGRTRR